MQIDRSGTTSDFAYSGGSIGFAPDRSIRSFKDNGKDSDLREVVLVLINHWRWILGSGVICFLAACLFILITNPLYTSAVSILVDPYSRTGLNGDGTGFATATPDPNLVESQVKILSSSTVLKRVIESEHLDEDEEFIGSGSDQIGPEMRSAKAIAALSKKLIIKKSERTYVIDIEISTNKADKSARVANALAEAYIIDQQAARASANKRDLVSLTAKLSQQQVAVREAYSDIQKFKLDNHIADVNGKLLNEQELVELTTALNLARLKTRDLKSRAEQWQKFLDSGRPMQVRPESLQSGTLERLWSNYADIIKQKANYRTTLGERHPAFLEVETQLKEIRRLIDNEIRALIQSAQAEYQIAVSNEKEISRRLEESRTQSDNVNVLIVKLKELERNAEGEKLIYNRLLKTRDALNSDTVESSASRIIANATPALGSSYPKTLPTLIVSIAMGLFMGAGGALFKDYIENSEIQRTQQYPLKRLNSQAASPLRPASTKALSHHEPWVIPVPLIVNSYSNFGQSTNIAKYEENKAHLSLKDVMTFAEAKPHSQFARSIDSIRDHLMAIWFGLGPRQVKTLLVTSGLKGAGRTSLCTNLAYRFSDLGLRVLIIDADYQNPDLSSLMTASAKPSIVNIAGRKRVLYQILSQGQKSLSIVPILSHEEQIIRRIEKTENDTRIMNWKNHFDVVIIDDQIWLDCNSIDSFGVPIDHILYVVDGQREHPSQINRICHEVGTANSNLVGLVISKTSLG